MNIGDGVILITGSGGKIGRFLAESLLPSVSRLVLVDINEAAFEGIEVNDKIVRKVCNVSDPAAVQLIVNELVSENALPNVVINNAGIIHSEPLVNLLSREDKKHKVNTWKQVIDVNLNGVFYVTAAVCEQWVTKRVKGVIINISSIAAQGNAGQSAYAATKAAVEALTKTWSKELGMFKIRSACIAPGFFDTESTRGSLSEATLQKWQKAVPLQRLGDPAELASAVKFIIENDYFNGKVLSIDGGLTI